MSEPQAAKPGHETRDVNFNAIFGLAGLSIVLGAVIGLGVWFLFQDMRERQGRRLAATFPMVRKQKNEALPPAPQLEGIERMKEPWGTAPPMPAKGSSKYEWVNRQAGVVRIPMDRAMAIIIERKLIKAAEKPSLHDLRDPHAGFPSPANSGRPAQKEQP
jgi:hypothetical protein